MHYYNGLNAAKRIGISYKTLLRYIEKGRIIPEQGKTPTGQLVISEDQVESLRIEVQKERDMFRQLQPDSPSVRHHETPMDTQGVPLTDTTLNEALKQLGKLQARVDVQDARIAELERRITELEAKPYPVIAENVTIQPIPSIPMDKTSKTESPLSTTTEPNRPIPSDLPPGTLHSSQFADQLGIKRTVFDSMMKNGIAGEELERTKIPIVARPGQNRNYFTPSEQRKALELLKKHGKLPSV